MMWYSLHEVIYLFILKVENTYMGKIIYKKTNVMFFRMKLRREYLHKWWTQNVSIQILI